MALKPLNSVAGFSVGETPANIILANGDITTNNLSTTGKANLNAISNVIITGGTAGQVIQTDGAGNLSFTTINTAQLANGNSNVQVLANSNVTVSVGGTANVATFTSTGMNVAGYITGANITATGNISVNNYIVTPSTVDLIVAPDTQLTRFYSNVNPFSGGYSLGNSLARWDNVFANTANIDGNVSAGNVLTNNLLYANGQPWDLQEAAGANNEIQFNEGDNFSASANFTFNPSTNLLTVNGNAQFNNANLGNLATANYANFANDLVVQGNIANANNISATNNITSNTANVTGNLTTGNANLGNLATANNFSTNGSGGDVTLTGGNVVGANVVVANSFTSNGGTIDFATNNPNIKLGNIGNVHINGGSNGQVISTDGAGNLSFVTIDTYQIQNGNSNVVVSANSNVTVAANGINVLTISGYAGNAANNVSNIAGQLGVSGNVTAPNFIGNVVGNISGNITIPGSNTGVVFNDDGVANSTLGFTFDKTSNAVTANGNLTVNNANLGNLVTANFADISSNLITNNLTVNVELSGNTANFSGNVVVPNLTVNLEVAGNTANFIGNVTLSGANVTVNNHLSGNVANFSGNITSLNANLGNIADANYIRTQQLYNGSANIDIINNGNIAFSPNLANVMVLSNVGANITGYVTANGNGTFGALYSNTVTAQGGNLTLSSEQAGNSYIQLRTFGDGTVDVGNVRITSLAMPNASTDAASKQYVDDVAQGLNIHDAALAATANTLANLTGGTITYNNGASGVGANLVLSGTPTLNYLSANVFDGNVTAVVGSRILVKQETNGAYNGVYVVSNSTVLTRAADFNSVPEVEAGDFIFVQDGDTYNDSGWVQTSVVVTIGTDPILFTQFSGAGTYQAGQGLTLTGTVFSVNTDGVTTEISGGNVIVKANAQFTTPNIGAATGTSVDLTGNVLAGNVNSNAKVTAVDFEASGNIIASNISANANLLVNNATINLELSGNTANFSGNVVIPNLTVNTTLSGNIGNFTGNITSLNANLGNLATANYVNVANTLTTLDANVTGTLTVANANIGGNLTVNNLTVNLELAGNTANFSGNVVASNFSTTGASGNISGANVVIANSFTSNGGTIDFATNNPNVKLGNVGNVHITGGSNGQILQTDGTGNLSWSSAPNISIIQNGTSNVTIPTANGNVTTNVNGNATVNVTDTGANITGYANISGNVFAPAIVQNARTYDTRIALSSAAGIIEANANGNATQFLPGGSMRLPSAGASDIIGGSFDGSKLVLGASQTDLVQNRGGNVTVQTGTSGTTANTWTFAQDGNLYTPGAVITSTVNANTSVLIGNSTVTFGNVTTTSVTANQTIASFSITGVTGVEYLVKAVDATGSKYSVATVLAVTDGTNADYTIYGSSQLGGYTGSLAVNVSGSFIRLQVTPASSNSTVWTTQYRLI